MTPWNAEAQQHLDQANRIFPARYHKWFDQVGRWQVTDTLKKRSVAVSADPVVAVRKTLASARSSLNNRNQPNPEAEHRSISLTFSPEVWQQLEATGNVKQAILDAVRASLH